MDFIFQMILFKLKGDFNEDRNKHLRIIIEICSISTLKK